MLWNTSKKANWVDTLFIAWQMQVLSVQINAQNDAVQMCFTTHGLDINQEGTIT